MSPVERKVSSCLLLQCLHLIRHTLSQYAMLILSISVTIRHTEKILTSRFKFNDLSTNTKCFFVFKNNKTNTLNRTTTEITDFASSTFSLHFVSWTAWLSVYLKAV